jgi:hypothetical protein
MTISRHQASRTGPFACSSQDRVKDLIGTMGLTPEQRHLVEHICAQWVGLEDILETAAGPREPVGELLVKAGRITRAQLDQALAEQRQGREKLGEILVRKCWLTDPELAALLAFQERLGTAGVQHAGPLQLGNLLVSAGKITFEQLQDGIRRQRGSKKRIGEALVEAGYTSQEQITQGLSLQRVLVGAALAALLLLSLTPGKARATTSSKSAQMRVSATVSAYVKLDVLQQQPSLTITPQDIQRGYVDVSAGTSLRTRTNDRNGFLVNFDPRSAVFERVSVTGIGGTVEIGSGGGTIRAAYSGPESLAQVSYRFYLAQGVQSGNYPWPLQISASVSY